MSESEVQEHRWRASSWVAMHTTQYAEGQIAVTGCDESWFLGPLKDVLRKSLPHLTVEFVGGNRWLE